MTSVSGVGRLPPMDESTWKRRLRAKIVADGRKMKAISLAAGLGETFVRDLLKRDRDPTIGNLMALAKTLGTTICELTEEEQPTPNLEEVLRRLAEIERAMKTKSGSRS